MESQQMAICWCCGMAAVRCDLRRFITKLLEQVRAVGGLDYGYARGVFVSDYYQDRVHNVYWDGDWKVKEIDISYNDGAFRHSIFFGSNGGKSYLLHGSQMLCNDGPHCTNSVFTA